MILSQAQVEVLERLQTARASGVADPVYLGRMGAVAFSIVPSGYVTVTEQKGKRLYAVTDAGVAALARNAEQLRLFVREPGISDAKEAGLLLRVEEEARCVLTSGNIANLGAEDGARALEPDHANALVRLRLALEALDALRAARA